MAKSNASHTRTLKILRDARRLLENGWTKWTLSKCNTDGTCRYCALGAVFTASGALKDGVFEGDDYADVLRADADVLEACRALAAETGADRRRRGAVAVSNAVYNRNDSPHSTRENTLAWFDRAIDTVKSKKPNKK